jgi:hypothetical protein
VDKVWIICVVLIKILKHSPVKPAAIAGQRKTSLFVIRASLKMERKKLFA